MAHPNDGRTGARDEALRGLVDRGVLSDEQAVAVREALDAAAPAGTRVRWAETVGYIGGGLLLAGAFALVATSWEDMTRATRVGLLAAVTVACVGGGITMAGGPRAVAGRRSRVPTVRRRITGVLFALAAVTAALAVGVFVEEPPDQAWLAASAAGLVVAVAGYAALPSAVGLVACGGMAVTTAFAVGARLEWEPLPTALLVIAVGVLMAALAGIGAFVERRLGLGLGAAVALIGAQHPPIWGDEVVWAYSLTLAVALACLGYYHWERSGVLLVFGILGVTIAVPELVWDVTDGAIGAAAVLLLAGSILLLASWVGIRLHRNR